MNGRSKTKDRLREASAAWSKPSGVLSSNRDWFFALLLVVVTMLVYQPAWNGKPVWDDDAHLTKPELVSLNGLARIWTEVGATQQYYPLSHSAFWMEHRLWGDGVLGYHLINILLHAGAALLLLKTLRRLEVPGAWLAATIFALHPVQVESVAWIAELKNTLSGVCYLGAALMYLSFDRNRKWMFHAGAFGLFVLGLMSKTAVATLPAALLIIFWWKRGQLSWKKEVLPLLPFFAVGAGAGLFTAWVERKFIGAEGSDFNFSLIERGLIAGRAFWFYLGKLFWPADLIFIYPHWNISQAVWWQYLFPAAALLLLAGFWLLRRRSRGPLAALLFFAGTLFPALGFFNVYPFRYSFVADHFQYLAVIGPVVLVAYGITAAGKILKQRNAIFEPILGGVLLMTLGTLSWRQCAMYADAETFWQTTIRRNPDCPMAYYNLGLAYFQQGRLDDAIAQYQKVLQINPDETDAVNNLGSAFLQQGRLDEAIAQYQKVLALKPDHAKAHNYLGLAYIQRGQMDEAMAQYQMALALKPDYAEPHYNLGNAFLQQGQMDRAMAQYQKALALAPDYAEAHNNLGNIFIQQGRVEEAIVHFQKALALKPDYADAHNNLASAFLQQGRMDEAVTHFQKALALKPDDADVHDHLGNALLQQGRTAEALSHYLKALTVKPDDAGVQNKLAWLLATSPQASLRNGDQAIELAHRANQLTGGSNPVILCTLAAAWAEAGRFPEAVATAQRALQLAEAQSNQALADDLRSELKLYQASIPFHTPE